MGPWTSQAETDLGERAGDRHQPVGLHPALAPALDTDLTINSFTVFDRSFGLNDQILNPWPRLAGRQAGSSRAPFRCSRS